MHELKTLKVGLQKREKLRKIKQTNKQRLKIKKRVPYQNAFSEYLYKSIYKFQ